MHDLVIRNGTVVDGTGAERKNVDVAIDNDKIVDVSKAVGPGKREIDELTFGTGSYQMNADGTGTVTVTYAYPTNSRSYTYEFVVTNAVELAAGKRLAIHLFAAGTTGGLDGQLFAPTFTRQVVPLSNSAR